MTVGTRRWLLVSMTVPLCAGVWLLWPAPATTQPPTAARESETTVPGPPLRTVALRREATPTPVEESSANDEELEPDFDWLNQATRRQLIEVARHHCPWPPHPSTWYTLNERCETALNRFFLTDDWRRALDNPLGTRRAVVAALDNPECRPHLGDAQETAWSEWPRWRGEPRPELRELCAADAMVRLADLQHKCVEWLHQDWANIFDEAVGSFDRSAAELSYTQDDYYQQVEDDDYRFTHRFWETHTCRTVHAAVFDWLDTLPEPPGDPAASRYNRPHITQSLLLYDAARRLGAEVPEWALPRERG